MGTESLYLSVGIAMLQRPADRVGGEAAPEELLKQAPSGVRLEILGHAPPLQEGLNRGELLLGRKLFERRIDEIGRESAGFELAPDPVAAAAFDLAGGTDVRGRDTPVIDESVLAKLRDRRVDGIRLELEVD